MLLVPIPVTTQFLTPQPWASIASPLMQPASRERGVNLIMRSSSSITTPLMTHVIVKQEMNTQISTNIKLRYILSVISSIVYYFITKLYLFLQLSCYFPTTRTLQNHEYIRKPRIQYLTRQMFRTFFVHVLLSSCMTISSAYMPLAHCVQLCRR